MIKNPKREEFIQNDTKYTLVLKDNMWYRDSKKEWEIHGNCIVTQIKDLNEGVNLLRRYIKKNNLGSGCSPYSKPFCGGAVYNQKGEYVGHYSYNGRFWDTKSEYPYWVQYI